jgi:hypothetical protein
MVTTGSVPVATVYTEENMRLEELTAADFPGVDPEKFEEWKALTLQVNRLPLIGLAIVVLGSVVTVPLIGGAIGWGIPVIAFFAYMIPQQPKKFRCAKLYKELGIKDQLKRKLKERR